MKYLVMECHPAYVVVLDEKGCFRKAANQNYQVGQTLTHILPMRTEEKHPARTIFVIVGAAAACFLIFLASAAQLWATPYGSVLLQINPEVRLEVDRNNRVLEISGANQDGVNLIADYHDYKKKPLEIVADELVDRAAGMGYLSPGESVHIYLDSDDNEWAAQVSSQLNQHLTETHEDIIIEIQIQLPISQTSSQEVSAQDVFRPESSLIQIPIEPAPSYSDSDYGISSSDDNDDHNDSDDEPFQENSDSNYDPSEEEPSADSPYEQQESSHIEENTNYDSSMDTPDKNDSGYSDSEDDSEDDTDDEPEEFDD
ncbi:MAG: anti-sigma-I factor RsgI family protein [Candidatus Merdivicinus sp.]|jgi:hypothetical protein